MERLVKRVLEIDTFAQDRFVRQRGIYRAVRGKFRLFRYKYPLVFITASSTYCTLSCSYCIHREFVEKGKLKLEHMGMDVFWESLRFAERNGFYPQICTFTGFGEPFLDLNLCKKIQIMKEKFPASVMALTTNGTVSFDKRLIGCLDSAIVSLNFIDRETYRRMNGVDWYDRVVRNILDFVEGRGDASPQICLQLLGHHDNLKDQDKVREFKAFWRSHLGSRDLITVPQMHNWAGGIEQPDCQRLKGYRQPCELVWQQLYITPAGDVYPCCFGEAMPTLKLGNILSDSYSAIFRNIKSLRRRHRLGLTKGTDCWNCSHVDALTAHFFRFGAGWV